MTSLVKLDNISRAFGGVQALSNAQFDLRAGEVHALLGENGAGKSTLMKILAGSLQPDAGMIELDGIQTSFRSPRDAFERGVTLIHQEMALAADLSVAENVFLSEIPNFIHWPHLKRRARHLIEKLGFDIPAGATISDLSIAHCQVVEIAKALSHDSKILIFDEPTAVLAMPDAERLLDIIRGLRDEGAGIVYISHRLDEVFSIADRITILKDGTYVDTLSTAETTSDDIIEKMVGRKLESIFGEDVERSKGEIALSVDGLSAGTAVRGASFSVAKGEILGIGGLVGAGRSELVRAVFGADQKTSGEIRVHGEKVRVRNPRDATRLGMALVPENRKEQGVVIDAPIKWNVSMPDIRSVSNRLGFIRHRVETLKVSALGRSLKLKAGSLHDDVSSLSGGNQQKVVLAKWLFGDSSILFFDEPTRGVDVGAKTEIYTLIRQLAAEGKAIVVISSEHNELFGICDRVLVMREGEITGELTKDDYSETRILELAMRGKAKENV